MSAPHLCIVKPRKGGGYELEMPLMAHRLWYLDESAAVNFAHHQSRIDGAIVLVLNRRGDVEFCERSQPCEGARDLHACG